MEFFILIILFVSGIMFFAYRSHQNTVAAWNRAARELHLEIQQRTGFSKPIITGTLQSLPVRIDTYTQRSGNNSTTYTRYQVRYPSAGFDFKLSREGGFSTFVGRFLGIKDQQVGDPLFDEAFKVKTSDPNRLQALLTPSVRNGLFRLLATYPSAVVSEDHIGLTSRKFESSDQRIVSTIQRLVATAQLLRAPTAGVSDQIVKDREQGLLTEVAERIRQAVEENPEDVDQRIFEVETLAAAGEEAEAVERIEQLEQIAPADPDVVGWKEALSTPPEPKRATSLDVDEVATDLFGGNELSFETRSKFNDTYAGANITWEGQVKQTRRLGETATVTVTVAAVSNDLYGNTEVDVVVDVAASDAPADGDTVTVAGMLTKIDPLMRNIYVENGRLS